MALHLIIDGYNLIRASPELSKIDVKDLEEGRKALLAQLAAYRRIRRHKITVVFDGWKNSGTVAESRDIVSGIHVIFSPLGVEADQIIKRLVQQEREKAVAISSDREIIDYAQSHQATALSAQEFLEKLTWAVYALEKGGTDTDEVETRRNAGRRGKGKGPSKRKPKQARRNRQRLHKL